MCFKKKVEIEDKSDFVLDRQTLLLAAQEMDVIIMLAKNKKEELVEELERIKDMIRYLSPSEDGYIYALDGAIKNQVQELKMLFNREYLRDFKIIEQSMRNLKISIKEREAKEVK